MERLSFHILNLHFQISNKSTKIRSREPKKKKKKKKQDRTNKLKLGHVVLSLDLFCLDREATVKGNDS